MFCSVVGTVAAFFFNFLNNSGRGERIRTSDLTVPNDRRGKNVSICLFESCSHQGISSVFTSLPILYHLI